MDHTAQIRRLTATLAEYGELVAEAGEPQVDDGATFDRLKGLLCAKADWTGSGARALLDLAEEHGAFMLRNAYALALVLGIEDGRDAQ